MCEPPAGSARMGEDRGRAGAEWRSRALSVRREAPGRFFVKIGYGRLVYGPLPLFPLPLSPWLGGGRRGRAVFAIFSPVVYVVSGGEIRPKLDGRGMQLLVQGFRLGPGRLLPPPRQSEGSLPITDLRGVPPPLSMLPQGHGGRGRHTWFINIFINNVTYTRGLAPFPGSLRRRGKGKGRRQGRYGPRGGRRQRGVGWHRLISFLDAVLNTRTS